MSDIDDHPDFASASFQADVMFDFADRLKRAYAEEATRMLWGSDAVARLGELLDGGMEIAAACDQIDAEWTAKPRKIRGLLNPDA